MEDHSNSLHQPPPKLFNSRSKFPKHTFEHLACFCSVCQAQRKIRSNKESLELQAKEDFANYEGEDQSFPWLLEHIGKASNEHILKLNIPETVVFHKSHAIFMITQKPDRSVKMITEGARLTLSELRKIIPTNVRQRKKDENKEKTLKIDVFSKEMALVKFMNLNCDNEDEHLTAWQGDGALKVLNENEFLTMMNERAGSLIWKRISYIQGVVKTKTGLNGSFFVNYYAHIEHDKRAITDLHNAGLALDEKTEGDMMADEKKYAEFVSKKIAYTLAVYCQIEVLRLCAEFIKDDNGKVWFVGASRLAVRQMDLLDPELQFKKVQLRSSSKKDELNEDLKKTDVELSAVHKMRMNSQMSTYYSTMKEKLGIPILLEEKPKDPTSDEVFKQLRPYSRYSLSQMTNPDFLKSINHLSQALSRSKKVRMTSRDFRVDRIEPIRQINPFTNPSKISKASSIFQSVRVPVFHLQSNLHKKSLSSRSHSLKKSSSRLDPSLKTWLTPEKRSRVSASPLY
jgi:hypothetical protein